MNRCNLIDVLKANNEKMNFQQNMCFQLKNWSIVITVGIISVAWNLDKANITLKIVSIFLHLPLLIFLFYFIKMTRNWMYYFIIFRERSKLLENILIEDISDSSGIINLPEYYEYHKGNSYKNDVDLERIRKDFKNDTKDNFYIYLIGLTCISAIALIIYALC